MAVKSIIDVQVNDDAFKQFSELFDQYKDALGDSNYQWGQINDKQADSVKQFQLITAALLAQNELMKRRKDAANDNEKQESKTTQFWQSLVRLTREVNTNVESTTKKLLSWASLGTIGGGLLGLGGLWGLDSLAHNVSAGRRSALGLGIGYGERQAFGLNYSRLVNPDQYLGGVSEALRDVTLRRTLYGAGMTEGDLAGKNTAQVGSELLLKLKGLADQTPTQFLSQVLQARGLGQFISVEDFQRLKSTPLKEVQQNALSYDRDRRTLALGDPTAKAWQDFSVQMHRAGQTIENTFVRGLTPLIPALTRLSSSVSKSIDTFLKSPKLGEWITEFGKGLETAAKYISSDKFQKDIRTFVTDFGLVAEALVRGLKWLHIIPDNTPKPKSKMGFWSGVGTLLNPFDLSPSHNAEAVRAVSSGWRNALHLAGDPFTSVERRYHLPSGLLLNQYGAESAYGARAGKSRAGASGPFQFMPGTAKRYGLSDTGDVRSASDAAGHYLFDLRREFGGDLSKAVAAYNWGEGHLHKDIARHGDRWREFLPKETKDYLNKVLNGANLSRGVKIVIENNTGGSAVVQTSQLAH